jgi:hypothetical protein
MLDTVPETASLQSVMKDAEAFQIAGTRCATIGLARAELIGMIDLTSLRWTAASRKTTGLVPDRHVIPLCQSWPIDRPAQVKTGATPRFDGDRGDC